MGFWQRQQQRKLYKQWEKHSELPAEVAPREVTPGEGVAPEAATPEFVLPPVARDDSKIGIDVKAGLRETGWCYRFRVRIRDAVSRLLRVD